MNGLIDAPGLLALAPKSKIPNYDALQLSPNSGWLILACAVCLVVFFMVHREAWRRLWLRMDDPRSVAVLRIVFVTFTLANVNGLWENWTYLFTDEGIFPTDVAQQVRARGQFAGYGDGLKAGEPTGFFDFSAFLEWLKGPNYSLLLFDSSPTFFWIHMIAFEVAMLMWLVGYQTRWIKWVAWFLFHSIILRNTLYWEGTENVYRAFLLYLAFSRCGHAYSVDNWLRCRRLRKKGLLSEPDGPDRGAGRPPLEGKPALEPIYRMIPGWPRLLMMLQTATLYGVAGCSKNGPVWHRGDSFYYALNLDHFYRFPPQLLSSLFGTNFFRLNTFIVHYWQAFFPMVVVGLVLRWHMREKLPPLSSGARRLGQIALLAFAALFLTLIIYTYPVHYRMPKGGGPSLPTVQWVVGIGTTIGVTGLVLLYRRLRWRPFRVTLRGHAFTIDLEWVCSWIFGRRVWLLLGALFHIHLIVMLNVGWFNPGLFATYVVFLSGPELANLAKAAGHKLSRLRIPMPASVRRGEHAIRAEDPLLPHHRRDGYRMPSAALVTALVLAIVGVLRDVQTQPGMLVPFGKLFEKKTRIDIPFEIVPSVDHVGWIWFGACIFVFLATVTIRSIRGHAFHPATGIGVIAAALAVSMLHARGAVDMMWALPLVAVVTALGMRKRVDRPADIPARDPESGQAWMPWAYGPFGRFFVGSVVVLHLFGVAIWLLPDKWCLDTFRPEARQAIGWWVRTTQTTQGWGMFAPNPPRANMFMRVLVHGRDGGTYDLQGDTYACFEDEAACDAVYPIPWITYTRQRKMNRRIAGSEGGNGVWAQKWHARWVCRDWALNHGGEAPEKVEIYKVTYPIPNPEHVAKYGPYDPAEQYRKKSSQELLHTTRCASSAYGELPNWIRERHGLPLLDERDIKVWHKNRCPNWERKLREQARERGEAVADDDPRFARCGGD